MNDKSPQEQRRFVLLLAGLSDAALGIFFALVALRVIPIFTTIESWIFLLIGGVFFTSGAFMTIFNITPRREA